MSRIIDSILKRNNDCISFEKIILPDNIITDQEEIKEATRNHFSKWSKENPPNQDYQKEWEGYYTPLAKIDGKIYEQLMMPFELKELINIIAEAPVHKAPGPTGISNEMLRHLPKIALSYLLELMNAYVKWEKVPK